MNASAASLTSAPRESTTLSTRAMGFSTTTLLAGTTWGNTLEAVRGDRPSIQLVTITSFSYVSRQSPTPCL